MDGKAGLKLISTRTDKEIEDYKIDHMPTTIFCHKCKKRWRTIDAMQRDTEHCGKCNGSGYNTKKKNARRAAPEK
jgi:Zn finger protein HypA/HybF involved in hydrogenase expression